MRDECKCRRILINYLKNKVVLITVLFLFSIHQVTPAYIREIRCLKNLLTPEDCQEILKYLDSLKASNYYNSTQCFEGLANWTLYLKWKQKDSYAALKNRLRQIGGRTNLVSLIHNCFTRFRREVLDETIDDWGFYPAPGENGEKSNLEESFTKEDKEEKEEGQEEGKSSNSLRSRSVLSALNSTSTEYPCFKVNPYIILGIVCFIFVCACCSTLIIRRKIANWCQCLKCLKCLLCCKSKKKNKKSGKYSPIDSEKGRKSPRKRKASLSFKSEDKDDDSSKVLINTATQDSNASALKADAELTPTGCCQCCKKKKKKQKKNTRRKK